MGATLTTKQLQLLLEEDARNHTSGLRGIDMRMLFGNARRRFGMAVGNDAYSWAIYTVLTESGIGGLRLFDSATWQRNADSSRTNNGPGKLVVSFDGRVWSNDETGTCGHTPAQAEALLTQGWFVPPGSVRRAYWGEDPHQRPNKHMPDLPASLERMLREELTQRIQANLDHSTIHADGGTRRVPRV